MVHGVELQVTDGAERILTAERFFTFTNVDVVGAGCLSATLSRKNTVSQGSMWYVLGRNKEQHGISLARSFSQFVHYMTVNFRPDSSLPCAKILCILSSLSAHRGLRSHHSRTRPTERIMADPTYTAAQGAADLA